MLHDQIFQGKNATLAHGDSPPVQLDISDDAKTKACKTYKLQSRGQVFD